MKNKLISLIIIITLCFSVCICPDIKAYASSSGQCGDNLYWTLENGTLTISGSGDMYNFPKNNSVPWYSLRRSIYRIVFDNAVTSVGDNAFNTYSTVTEVHLPSSLKSIRYKAFYGTGIIHLQLPEGVETIGEQAFYLCKSLSDIRLPQSLITIGEMAFQNCYSLNTVNLPGNLKTIGRQAFYGCNSLYNITIPNTVTDIGYGAFKKTAYYNDSQNTIDGFFYVGDCLMSNEIGIVDSFTVREGTRLIAGEAFSGGRVKNITIPASVKHIGAKAIQSRYSLVTVDEKNTNFCSVDGSLFSKDKTVLYHYAQLDNVTEYDVPEGVKHIVQNAFEDADFEKITLPESLETIGDKAFSTTVITQIKIPANVKSIGKMVFFCCFDLKKITVHEDNIYFASHEGVLYEKASKRLIHYPKEKISNSYTIPDGVKIIDAWAIANNHYLKRLIMPTSVEFIGESAFHDCWANEIVLQKGIKVINSNAFLSCGIERIIIPEGVTIIESYAFEQCSNLKSITIPKTVISIGEGAFYQCFSLNDINYTGTKAQWDAISIGLYNNALTGNGSPNYNSPNPYVKCTVKFNTNGGVGVYEPQQVVFGTFVTPPDAPTKSEYVFTGWYANRACTGTPYVTASGVANRTVTEDITLYAGWEKTDTINWGADTFNFANNSMYFGGDYYISDEYYHILTKDLDYDSLVDMNFQRGQDFGGSCFGMTEVMALMKIGQLDPGFFDSGAKTAFDLPMPRAGNKTIASLMNYYYLSQFLPEVEDFAKRQQSLGTVALAKKLVDAVGNIEKTGLPVVVNYYLKDDPNKIGWAGHSILAYKLEDNGSEYVVYVADPNGLVCMRGKDEAGNLILEMGTPWQIKISYDFNTVSYKGIDMDVSTQDNTFKFHSVFTDTTAYSNLNIQEKLSQNKYKPPVELASLTPNTKITVNYPDFYLTNGEQSASISDEAYEGDLEITDSYATLNAGRWIYTLPNEQSYTITPQTDIDLYTTKVVYDTNNSFVYTESEHKPTITAFPDNKAEITSNEVGHKVLTMNVNLDYLPFDSISVSANAKNLKAEITNEGLIKFSSDSSLQGAKITVNTDFNSNEITVENNVTEFDVSYYQEQIYLYTAGASEVSDMTYKVIFYSMGGTQTESITNLKYGDTIAEPVLPEKEGFNFAGWYKDDEYSEKWDFNLDVVENNTILYAKWNQNPDYYCILTLKDSAETQQIILKKGESINLADYSPFTENDGYVLAGWSKSENNAVAYNVNDVFTLYEDTTLYPVLRGLPCTVSTAKAENGNYTLTTNFYGIEAPAQIVVAGYENNKLIYLKKLDYTSNTRTFTISQNADIIKVFVLDSLNNLKPVTKTEVISNLIK